MVATAGAVATDWASAWFPVAQLEMRAAAATAALGCGAGGMGRVVVGASVDVVVARWVDEVEVAGDALGVRCPARCTTASATPLATIATSTTMYETLSTLDIGGGAW